MTDLATRMDNEPERTDRLMAAIEGATDAMAETAVLKARIDDAEARNRLMPLSSALRGEIVRLALNIDGAIAAHGSNTFAARVAALASAADLLAILLTTVKPQDMTPRAAARRVIASIREAYGADSAATHSVAMTLARWVGCDERVIDGTAGPNGEIVCCPVCDQPELVCVRVEAEPSVGVTASHSWSCLCGFRREVA